MDDTSTVRATLNLKISEKRRLNISKQTTFSELKRKTCERFPILQRENIHLEISCNDPHDKSEAVPVSVSSEEEWRDILKDIPFDQLLNLNVTVSVQDVSNGPSRPPSGQSVSSTSDIIQTDSARSAIETPPDRSPLSFDSTLMNSVVSQASDDVEDQEEEESSLKSSAGRDTSDSPTSLSTAVTFNFSGDDPHTEQQTDNSIWPSGDGDTLSTIKVKKPAESGTVNSQRKYDLKGRKKGRLLVVNNKIFENLPEIRGTDFDATSLSILFKQLGFEVKSIASQTISMLRTNLEKEMAELRLSSEKYGCYCVVFLTHCENGGICGIDGDTMPFDEVIDRFNEVLPGKPKLFFAEGLRHDGQMTGSVKHCPIVNQQLMFNCTVNRDEIDSHPAMKSDVFFYLAGTLSEGLPSIKGSLMIQALVKVICENAHSDNFKTIIEKSQQLMDRAVSKSYRFRMPEVYHDSLRKDIYFF